MFKHNFLSVKEDLLQILKRGEYKGILFINVHKYRPGETHEIHKHSDREEIFIVFDGEGMVLTDEGTAKISKGDVLVFARNESHGFVSSVENPLKYICIGVSIS